MAWKHGGYSYGNHGCRCEVCTAANAARQAAYRARLAEKGPPEHGTVNAYTNYKCRCDECREAKSLADSEWYLRRKADTA